MRSTGLTAEAPSGTWTIQVSRDDPLKLNRLLLTNPVSAMLEECRLGARNAFSNMGWYANVVAVDPRDPDIVWVGGVDWFRSNDAGRTWGLVSHWWTEPTAPSFAHADQHAIAFHPAYDGTGNQIVYIAGDGGIYRSDNARAGATVGGLGVCTPAASAVAWRSLNRGYGVTQFYHGVPFPDGRRVIGGTQDNGTIVGDEAAGFDGWTRVFGGDGGYVAIDPANANTLYVETQWAAVRKSVDGGETFTTATRGLDPGGVGWSQRERELPLHHAVRDRPCRGAPPVARGRQDVSDHRRCRELAAGEHAVRRRRQGQRHCRLGRRPCPCGGRARTTAGCIISRRRWAPRPVRRGRARGRETAG